MSETPFWTFVDETAEKVKQMPNYLKGGAPASSGPAALVERLRGVLAHYQFANDEREQLVARLVVEFASSTPPCKCCGE